MAQRSDPRRRATTPPTLRAALALALGLCCFAPTGCRVDGQDIRRWETTAHGPDKLRAVLFYDKYEAPLRAEAALSLVRMKPRQGRRIGIGIMVETLASVSPEARQQVVALLVPAIVAELKKPPPVGQAGQPSPPDGSFPFKDAAFAMLTSERTVLVADEASSQSLKAALVEWALADFEHRLDNRTQSYGMEQLLRFIGAPAVAGLPRLMVRDARRLDAMASLVAEIGDASAKEAASAALVAVAKHVVSEEWRKNKKPELEAANAASKLAPTKEQFEGQLAQYQDEELFRILGSMKKVGGRPAVEFCLGFAVQKDQGDKRRQAALAALEGRLDRNNADDVKRILQIAASDAPDIVLDQAFRRIGEMPRELVVGRLYDLFKTDKWKVRKIAARTVLKMSTVKHVDEFMGKLPDGAARGFAMSEAISYGAMFGDLKEGKPLDAIKKYFTAGSPAARASAVFYWLNYGTTADLPTVQALEGDAGPVPTCDSDAECKWECEIAKEGAKDPKERELKSIRTIGELVRYCVEPQMRERQPDDKKEAKK